MGALLCLRIVPPNVTIGVCSLVNLMCVFGVVAHLGFREANFHFVLFGPRTCQWCLERSASLFHRLASAKREISMLSLTSFGSSSTTSLMYISQRSGAKTDPWGTPMTEVKASLFLFGPPPLDVRIAVSHLSLGGGARPEVHLLNISPC